MTNEFSELKRHDTGRTLGGRKLWELSEPLVFNLHVNGGGHTVTVPEGFQTDLASIPWLFWCVFPPSGLYDRAAVVHDYLCGQPECTLFMADAIFRDAMTCLGVPVWRRVIMYYAVRLFSVVGGHRWKRKKAMRWVP